MAHFGNAFAQQFGLRIPIVGAAMSGHSGFELAAAVARAGGFGFLGAGRYSGKQLKEEYNKAKELCRGGKEAVGIGLLNFAITSELLQAVIDVKPHAVWLAAGDMQPHFTQLHKARIPIIMQVNTLEEVQEAVEMGAAAIIAQGIEAGGHGRRFASTLSFVPEAADLVRDLCKASRQPEVPVLAAGGISDARQVAASLILGAQAAVLGTRLVATNESPIPQWSKEALVNAGSQASERPSTLTTGLFDKLDAPALLEKYGASWPEGCITRALQTPFTDQWAQTESLQATDADKLRSQVAAARKTGDLSTAPVWAGSSVGLIKSIGPAEDIVTEIASSALRILQQAPSYAASQ